MFLSDPEVDTQFKLLQKTMKTMGNNPFIGVRVGMDYKWYSYNEVGEMAENISHALIQKNLCPLTDGEEAGQQHRFLGIMAKNGIEWICSYISGWY